MEQVVRSHMKSFMGGGPLVGSALTSAVESVSLMPTFSAAELERSRVMIVTYANANAHNIFIK